MSWERDRLGRRVNSGEAHPFSFVHVAGIYSFETIKIHRLHPRLVHVTAQEVYDYLLMTEDILAGAVVVYGHV